MDSQHAKPVEMPPHLQTLLDELENSDLVAARITSGLSDAQANWQPHENAWSIAQCLDHLARSNTVYAAALQEAIKQTRATTPSRGPIKPGFFGGLFISTLEPPPKRKIRAPKKIVPRSQISGREALDLFLRSHEDVRAVIRAGSGFDLNRVRFRNPFFGFLRFTVGTGLLIMNAHDRRHLWQAERILESERFPKN